jgi:hypothetical protein
VLQSTPSPLFTEDGTAEIICKVYSQGEKAMDFTYTDAEIVAMARDDPETYGGKTQSEYFTSGSHPSLEDTARAVSAFTKKQIECC